MKPIFGRGPSLQLRLLIAIVISASLMLADSRLDAFAKVRYYLNSMVAPLQYLASMPRAMLDNVANQFTSHQDLLTQKQHLERQLLITQSELQQLKQLKQENQRLRALLGSPLVRDDRKMVAEVMSVDSDPYSKQVVIDKGYIDGVFEGQPVINEKGVVGQVIHVGAHNSRVLLLIDSSHAIPVQVVRNDIRVVASGRGHLNQLELENIPSSTDIENGDLLVTSGLGGRFPEGYPVAYVTSFSFDNQRPFAQVTAKPVVDFNRLRYLLLIWPNQRELSIQQGEPNAA
ncbi:Cell shape-determining protein MreC [Vibrio stylophorae]|uniref:Cell shape-determining protein MreC n=1 Tax=Vibrio stylophorae TaxID=659351 RepID=A0ABM8ZVW7_9VIBR|nr:rod shape-determining protein MreC [Vibrio stylophorae]CAH0534464.1 Cell shape-determining protein MreC [Vibrio stylophorae]